MTEETAIKLWTVFTALVTVGGSVLLIILLT